MNGNRYLYELKQYRARQEAMRRHPAWQGRQQNRPTSGQININQQAARKHLRLVANNGRTS